MKLSRIVSPCTAALCLALTPLALTASAAHAQQSIALPRSGGPILAPYSGGPILVPYSSDPIGQTGHPSPNIGHLNNNVHITEWLTPGVGGRSRAVKVYIKNQGSVAATNLLVSLVLWDAEGPIGVSHTYSVTVPSLLPNQGKWVSISGFRWPHVNQYVGYLSVGMTTTEKFQF